MFVHQWSHLKLGLLPLIKASMVPGDTMTLIYARTSECIHDEVCAWLLLHLLGFCADWMSGICAAYHEHLHNTVHRLDRQCEDSPDCTAFHCQT